MSQNYLIARVKRKFKYGLSNKAGKNNMGRTAVFGQGGGLKRLHFIVDNTRYLSSACTLLQQITTAHRNGPLGLVFYDIGYFSVILLAEGLQIGNKIKGFSKDFFTDNASTSFVTNSKLGTWLFNIETQPGKGAKLARSAGTGALVYSVTKSHVYLKLNSGWLYGVSSFCLASLGSTGLKLFKKRVLNKAGNNRKLGVRPHVRGVAMNPVDHPHGGGEGKKSPRNVHRTPWGKLTKTVPTKRKLYHLRRKKRFKLG